MIPLPIMHHAGLRTGLAALLFGFAPPLCDAASALSLELDYSVSVRGFPVGRAEIRAEIAGRDYAIAFSGGITGLARLFTDASTTAQARGRIGEERPLATDYSHVWVEDGETETVAMRFSANGVSGIALDPPDDHPERNVPVTAQHLANALDPVSAFLWPSRSGATADACARTLPLIDGKRRFDIDAAFDRMESFSVRNRYYRAVVCTIRYRAIAGHRADKPDSGFLSEGGGMEVWLVGVGDGLIVPVRMQLQSRIGRVVMQATRLEAE